jgi:hypothetical protein
MKRTVTFLLALTVAILVNSPLLAQWQKAPVTETRTVDAKGAVTSFGFTLPAGFAYWVHTTGTVNASNSGDRADGHYYIGGLTIPSGLGVPVGLRVRTSATNENYLQSISGQAFKSSNDYVDRINSTGSPLSFRFFDRGEPGGGGTDYYADNNGSLTVEISQFTPELIVQYDTLDYGLVPIGTSKTLADSIQALGKEALIITTLEVTPISGGDIYTINSERGYSFSLRETTNEFRITATPSVPGVFLAHLKLVTPNAFGGPKIIVLKGRAPAPDVTVAPGDTIDFGIVPLGGSKTLTKQFNNVGEVATQITRIDISAPQFTSTAPIALLLQIPTDVPFTFAPPAAGPFFATADVRYEHGGSKRLYLRGRGGVAVPQLSKQSIDFGTLVIGDDSTTLLTLRNLGEGEFVLTDLSIDNDQFSFIGPANGTKVGPNSLAEYQVSFKPTRDVQPLHQGVMTFKFEGMPDQTVLLTGRNGQPTASMLTIKHHFYRPGDEFIADQWLEGDLSKTLLPVQKLSEFITFDQGILEYRGVEKGELIEDQDWEIASSQSGGVIDITLSSSTERLTGPGKLLKLRFRVRDNAPSGTVTPLRQVDPLYYTSAAAPASIADGSLTVLDSCIASQVVGGQAASHIEQNRPNPFNPETEIPYSVGQDGHVKLELYDAAGQLIATLLDGHHLAGLYTYRLNASALSSGIYTYAYSANGKRVIKRMILAK